jgi:hypothetical protein
MIALTSSTDLSVHIIIPGRHSHYASLRNRHWQVSATNREKASRRAPHTKGCRWLAKKSGNISHG